MEHSVHKSYSEFSEPRNQFNEDNDCTVVAVSVACNIPYAEAHALLKAAGRKNRRGFSQYKYHPVIRQQGFEIQSIYKNAAMQGHPIRQVKAKTVRTVERELAKHWGGHRILINVSGHVLAWNGEKIVDWTAGRQHRIRDVYLVYPQGCEMPVHGRSVPVPERKSLNRPKMVRSAVLARCPDLGVNDWTEYRSVKAFYDAHGLNLYQHQKNRKTLKYWGETQFYAYKELPYYKAYTIDMRLTDMSQAKVRG